MSYSLMQRLGRGGMGVVDLAVDSNGRPVALKRLGLRGSGLEMHEARQRVRREAEVLGALDHPHIVALLDVIDDGDDIVLVMPYLSGGTLADLVRMRGPMPASAVSSLADELLGALAAAHRAGIVHRDIKPANVLFDSSGRAYLTDFGVAIMRGATSGLTGTQVVIGTPEYMAPEQARGERATSASDVFSMGATLRFAATGEPPFGRGDARVIMHRAAEAKVEPVGRQVPRDLRQRLEPMLDKRPERRPTAAAARGAAGDTRVLPHPAKPPRRRRSRRRIGLAAGAIAVVAALALVAGAVVLDRRTPAIAASDAPTSTTVLHAASSSTTAAPTTVPCTPLAYQPCGQSAAPFTDGRRCIDDHADYDQEAADGCEAAPDSLNGATLDHEIEANLVPAADVDRYPIPLDQHGHLFCIDPVRVSLTAPEGVSMRLTLLDGSTVLDAATSVDGQRATASVAGRNCLKTDGDGLVAEVSWIGSPRSAADYTLERSGGR